MSAIEEVYDTISAHTRIRALSPMARDMYCYLYARYECVDIADIPEHAVARWELAHPEARRELFVTGLLLDAGTRKPKWQLVSPHVLDQWAEEAREERDALR